MSTFSERDLERLRTDVDDLTALNEIAIAINLSMSIEDITSVILNNCLKRIPATQGAVFLLDDDIDEAPVFRTFVRKIADSKESVPLHINWSILGRMVKSTQLLAINDPLKDKDFVGIDFEQLGITSVLSAPLIVQSGLIGALTLFNRKTPPGFTGGDKKFLGIVATQTATVIENARLFREERKLRILEDEMAHARSIQEHYLPKSSWQNNSCEILGYNHPAKAVGGDYFDIFALGEDQVVVSLGDVAGKGVPAALLASEAQAVIRSILWHDPNTSLPDLTGSLNQLFVHMTRPDQYITAILGVFDCPSKLIQYVNAGHLPPLVLTAAGATSSLRSTNLVVGALPGIEYVANEWLLNPGDTLFLCSDGVTECFDPKGDEYGENRLREFLDRRGKSDLEEIRDDLVKELSAFRAEEIQSDDITFLMLRVK